MPQYIYACQHAKCKLANGIEVEHSMSECDTPSEKTLFLITCKKHGVMKRVPQLPQLMGAVKGEFKKESDLLATKQQQRKKRSKLHFKNEVLPSLKFGEKRHFEKKLKNLKGDHEKL